MGEPNDIKMCPGDATSEDFYDLQTNDPNEVAEKLDGIKEAFPLMSEEAVCRSGDSYYVDLSETGPPVIIVEGGDAKESKPVDKREVIREKIERDREDVFDHRKKVCGAYRGYARAVKEKANREKLKHVSSEPFERWFWEFAVGTATFGAGTAAFKDALTRNTVKQGVESREFKKRRLEGVREQATRMGLCGNIVDDLPSKPGAEIMTKARKSLVGALAVGAAVFTGIQIKKAVDSMSDEEVMEHQAVLEGLQQYCGTDESPAETITAETAPLDEEAPLETLTELSEALDQYKDSLKGAYKEASVAEQRAQGASGEADLKEARLASQEHILMSFGSPIQYSLMGFSRSLVPTLCVGMPIGTLCVPIRWRRAPQYAFPRRAWEREYEYQTHYGATRRLLLFLFFSSLSTFRISSSTLRTSARRSCVLCLISLTWARRALLTSRAI